MLWALVWWAGIDSGSTSYRYSASFAAQYAGLAPIASAMAIAWLIYAVNNGNYGRSLYVIYFFSSINQLLLSVTLVHSSREYHSQLKTRSRGHNCIVVLFIKLGHVGILRIWICGMCCEFTGVRTTTLPIDFEIVTCCYLKREMAFIFFCDFDLMFPRRQPDSYSKVSDLFETCKTVSTFSVFFT